MSDKTAGIIDKAHAGSLPITVRDLTYQAGGTVLLQVAEFEILPGGPTVILGPNGAGKSLFLRLLHGLIEPSSGTVKINGAAPDRTLRKRQAMVFQHPVLLRRSVAANIAYALKVHGISGAARRSQLQHLLAQSGLSQQASQPARTLSGGEQQRLALVRALAGSPSVLFLDEPTSGLDPTAAGLIEALIMAAARQGTKIVMVTHDLALAQRLAQTIVFFHQGKVCEQATGETFFKQPASTAARAFLASNLALWGTENG